MKEKKKWILASIICEAFNKEYNTNLNHQTIQWQVKEGWIGELHINNGTHSKIPQTVFTSICQAFGSYVKINQFNRKGGITIWKNWYWCGTKLWGLDLQIYCIENFCDKKRSSWRVLDPMDNLQPTIIRSVGKITVKKLLSNLNLHKCKMKKQLLLMISWWRLSTLMPWIGWRDWTKRWTTSNSLHW